MKIKREFEKDAQIKEITCAEFRESGALWWVNQQLHLFGMAIVWNPDMDQLIPTIAKFRGFSGDCNDVGYKKMSEYLKDNIIELTKDCEE